MAKRTFAFVAVFAALLSVTLSVQAEDLNYYWAGGSGSNYFTTANWRIGSESGSVATAGLGNTANSITAYIRNSNNVNISLDYSNLGAAVKTLNIGEIGGTTTATITRSGGTFNIEPNKTINVFDNGTFNISQGFTIDANGKMTVDGGTVSDTGSGLVVNGTLDIKRGTFTFNNSGNQIHGNGTINVTGGTFNVAASNSLRIGNAANSTLNISGGEVTVSSPSYIGVSDYTGTINQSGGNVTFNKELDFGWGNGAVGEYNLTGGTMTTTANAGLWTGNPSGISSFTVGGGTANFTQAGESFTVGLGGTNNLKNVFTITSGTVNVTDTFAVKYTGILNINGGEFNAPTITVDSVSTLNMTGGSLKTNAINMNGGTFTQGGGSLVYNGKLTVTGNAVLNGTIDMSKFLGAYNQTVDVIEATSITGSPSISGDWTIANDGTKITATYTGGAGKYYWTGATNNTYNTGSNWSINGAQYTETYITGSPATFDKDCYILTSNGAVNIDWGDFGVASLTVGNGVGGSTGTAEISRGGDEELKTQLTINKGGTATFGGAFSITSYNGTPATLTVNGGDFNANSSTTVSGKIVVDDGNYNANGAVTVNSGGSITINGGKFTYASGSNFVNNGTMTLSDDGEFVVNSGSGTFRVGGSSNDAEFKITGGKATFNTNVYIATSSEGTINQSGGETVFNSRLILGWGDYGGTYNLTGGTLNANNAAGLWNANSSGVSTFNVEGGVANFKNSGESFTIGLSNDGTQYTGLSLANVFNLKSGTVNAADTFAIQYSGTLNVGQSGAGDGVLNAKGITLSNNGNLNMSAGTINLGSGGITNSEGSYNINLSGGTFGTNSASWSSALTAKIESGTVTFDPDAGRTITWSGALTDAGGVTKTGAGTLTLSGANTYTGATTIETGTINVDNGGSLTGTTNLIVGSSGESLLDVKQGGSVTVNGGSTVGSDGKGAILVENGGSFVSTGNILLAEKTSNTGTITVQNGGYLKSQDIQVGSMGNAVVDNYGTIEVVDTVKIGRDGDSNTGVVNVYEGATLTATTIFPGVTMPGTLNINGGSVTVTNGVALHGRGTNATGTVTITNGGSLTTPFLQLGNVNFTTYAVDTTITLDDGTLSVVNVTYPRDGSHANNVNATVNLGKGTVITGANTGVESIWWAAVPVNLTYANGTDIQVDNGKTAKFNSPVSGAGGLNKTGDGTLILNGINTYSGKTTISAGTLEISNNFTSSSGLAGSGTLKLSGSEKDYYFGDASGFTGTVQVFDNTISTKSRVRLVVGPDGTTPPNTDLSNATVDINGRKVSNNEYFSEIAFTKACSLSIGTLNGNEYSRFLSIDRNTTAGTTTTYANLIVSNGTYAGQIGRNDTNDNSTTAFVNHINFVKADDGTADGGKLTLSNKYMYYKGTTTIEGGTLEFTNNLSGNNYQYFARSTALKGSGNLDFVGNNWTVFSIDTTDTTTPQEFSGTVNVSGSIMLTKEGLGAARDLNLGNATINVKSTGLIGLYGHTDTAVSNLTAKELNVESGGVIRICKHDPGSAFGTLTVGRGLISGTLGQENTVWNQVNLVKVSDGSETGGRLTISGNNYYNGATTVNAGVLELTGDAVVANGPVTVANDGTLEYNVASGKTKKLSIDATNKILSTGQVIKTGDGTLQLYALYAEADKMIDVNSLTVSSGRVDIKEYFYGKLIVDSEGTFSPGNSVGSLTIGESAYGTDGFILNDNGAELLMEIAGSAPTANDVLIVNGGDIELGDGSVITLALTGNSLGRGESFTAILSADNSSTLDVLSHIQTTDFTDLKYVQINDATHGTVYAITGRTLNANEVPEPSTWALLALGVCGLLYLRKRS